MDIPQRRLDAAVAALATDPTAAFGAGLVAGFQAVVGAGTNLSAARPVGAAAVYWKFDTGVVVGTDGANIVNAAPGDTYYVAP